MFHGISRRPAFWPVAAAFGALALAACTDEGPTGPDFTPVTGVASVAGASYTATNSGVDGAGHCNNGLQPDPVNCNLYDGKEFVWLNAGPSGAALPDGNYFFAVLAPSGQSSPNDGGDGNLSDDFDTVAERDFSVLAGVVTYVGPHDFDGEKIRLFEYADTPNNGGVYILAICTMPHPAAPAQCKYDAFKAREGDGGGGEEGDPEMSGLKYFDSNRNGQHDAGEPGIPGWLIDWQNGTSGTETTDAGGFFFFTGDPDTYTVQEQQPTNVWAHPGTGWYQTGNTVNQAIDAGAGQNTMLANFVYTVTAVEGGFTDGLNFGNVCRVSVDGRTMGFWSNKNGQKLITAGDITALNNFFLANATGDQGNFTGSLAAQKTAYRNWLLAANATNMAYMLSAQMSATYLDVQHGFTDPTTVVDWFDSAYDDLYPAPRTVQDMIDYANHLLSIDQSTIAADAMRTEQGRVKDILDTINNAGSFYPETLALALTICGEPDFAAQN